MRRGMLVLGLLVVFGAAVAGSGAATPSAREAEAIFPLKALVRAVVGSISQGVHRGKTYERLEAQRDEEIAATKPRDQIIRFQQERGWLDAEAAERERLRQEELRKAITERTEREKRITKEAYERAIGREWKNAAASAVPGLVGLDGFAGGLLGGIIKGDSPLNAAVNALSGDAPNSTQSLDDLKKQLIESRAKLKVARDKKLTQRLDELITEMENQPPGERVDVARTLLRDEIDAVDAALAQAKTTWKDWTGNKVRIDEEKFAKDARWQGLNAHVEATKLPTSTKAVIAGLGRAAAARVDGLTAGTGVKLSEEDLMRIAAEAGARYVEARARAKETGEAVDIDLDALVRSAINEHLAAAGLDPLPEDDDAAVVGAPTAAPADDGKPKAVTVKGTLFFGGREAAAVEAAGVFVILESAFEMGFPAEDGPVRGTGSMTVRTDSAKLIRGSEDCITDQDATWTFDGQIRGTTVTGTIVMTARTQRVVSGCDDRTFENDTETGTFVGTFDRATGKLEGQFVDAEQPDAEFFVGIRGTAE